MPIGNELISGELLQRKKIYLRKFGDLGLGRKLKVEEKRGFPRRFAKGACKECKIGERDNQGEYL